ncbi:MAG: hypothetical protein GY790_02060 [Bacteroidetes bacterium]|nr:hypothetical protein [Bacteroidota bacterium]
MPSFFLLIDKSVNEETASLLNDSLEEYDSGYRWIFVGDRIGIAMESSETNSTDPKNRELLYSDCFFVDDKSGCCIVSDSRIDYRRELAGKLDVKWNVAKGFSDCKLILLAYLKWKEECLSHLYGDFSFVIWDSGKDEVLCARDHFGCRPLYYVDQPGFLAVASKISAFKSIPGFRFKIRTEYILDSICSIETNESISAYRGIGRLKPAHYLQQKKGHLFDQNRYWDLRINENYRGLTINEASRGLRDRIIEAVRQRSLTFVQIGVELSGGLDSSGIASVLTMLVDQNVSINAFTHSVSSDPLNPQMDLKSEMEFSTALVEKYNTIRQFEITGENSMGGYSALIKALNILNKPINLHYAMNSDLLFEMAG